MTLKQQIATGFLAALIVSSVAFMPASADTAPAKPAAQRHSGVVSAKSSAVQAHRDKASELTYN